MLNCFSLSRLHIYCNVVLNAILVKLYNNKQAIDCNFSIIIDHHRALIFITAMALTIKLAKLTY